MIDFYQINLIWSVSLILSSFAKRYLNPSANRGGDNPKDALSKGSLSTISPTFAGYVYTDPARFGGLWEAESQLETKRSDSECHCSDAADADIWNSFERPYTSLVKEHLSSKKTTETSQLASLLQTTHVLALTRWGTPSRCAMRAR